MSLPAVLWWAPHTVYQALGIRVYHPTVVAYVGCLHMLSARSVPCLDCATPSHPPPFRTPPPPLANNRTPCAARCRSDAEKKSDHKQKRNKHGARNKKKNAKKIDLKDVTAHLESVAHDERTGYVPVQYYVLSSATPVGLIVSFASRHLAFLRCAAYQTTACNVRVSVCAALQRAAVRCSGAKRTRRLRCVLFVCYPKLDTSTAETATHQAHACSTC